MMPRSILVKMENVVAYNLSGYQPYTKMLELQHSLSALRIEGQIGNVVLMLEHSPVISIGKTPGAAAHVRCPPDVLKRQGIEVCETNRGGDATYHGPGQLVVYFILSLSTSRDIHWFVRMVEKSVIALLAAYEIQAHIKPEYPGVWVAEKKICALGIAVRKWVTMHGIALNVCPNLTHFGYIIPCGIYDKGVTSLYQVYQEHHRTFRIGMEQIKQDYVRHFSTTFQVTVVQGEPQQVWQYVC